MLQKSLTTTIDGQECIKVDEWGTEKETYVLGNSVTDKQFFYAEVNGVSFEYDYQPQRGEVEEDYLNEMAERDIDRHEAEVFARIEGSDNAQDGVEEAPLVAEDVQNLVLINREYSEEPEPQFMILNVIFVGNMTHCNIL